MDIKYIYVAERRLEKLVFSLILYKKLNETCKNN